MITTGQIAEYMARAGASVMIVAPHPDDESLATGALIQTAIAGGARVTVVVLTDGENNAWPQRAVEFRVRIGKDDRARWGARRRDEARRALALLGVPPNDVHFLGLPDLGLTSRLMLSPTEATAQVRAIVQNVGATVVVAPSLHDTHPDHSAAHIMARTTVAAYGFDAAMLSYMVHGRAQAATPRGVVSDETLARKMNAVAAHASQHVLSGRRMRRYAHTAEQFELEDPCTLSASEACVDLPWRLSRLACSYVKLLVVSSARAWSVPVHVGRSLDADSPVCFRRADGRLRLDLPRAAGARTPVFAKLVARVSSPWIYDRWGWTLIDTGTNS